MATAWVRAALAAACVLPASANAAWHQPVGGPQPINQDASKETGFPRLVSVGGVPHVVWNEDDGSNLEVRVATLNSAGTAWTQPWFLVSATHGSINENDAKAALDPNIADVAGVPYVVWREDDGVNFELRVARRRSTGVIAPTWVQPWTGVTATYGGINIDAAKSAGVDPVIASVGGVPYVAWIEPDATNDEVRVKRLNAAGTAWETLPPGADLNDNPSGNAQDPTMADVGGTLYVGWSESDGSDLELHVKVLGEDWQEPPPGVTTTDGKIEHDPTKNAHSPSLASVDGVPYIAFLERDGAKDTLRVARFNTTTHIWSEPWAGVTATSGGINQSDSQDARDPSLTSIGGVPYVAWRESDGTNIEMRVARLNAATNAWEQVVGGPSPINQDPTKNAFGPSLASIGGVPWVAWQEDDYDIRASRLEPEFTSLTATPSQTGATFTAGLHTYGIPYPVGFQFGSALENETAVTTTAAGVQNVSISAPVGSLTPATTYQFRPFATAGVAAPRVQGTPGTFTTLALPPPLLIRDTTSPAFLGTAKADPATFAVDPRGAPERAVTSVKRKKRPKKGTTLRYTLSEAARVVFTIERKGTGRKVGRTCRKQTRSNRRRRACTLYTRIGAFAQQGRAGRNTKKFSGRIGRKKLAIASYRATLVARDAAGNRSKAKQISFRVVAP